MESKNLLPHQKVQIQCPKCFSIFLISDPEISREVRCGKCKVLFQVNLEKASIIFSKDITENSSNQTIDLLSIKRTEQETIDATNKTLDFVADNIMGAPILTTKSQTFKHFLKINDLKPKASLVHQSNLFESSVEDSSKYIYGEEIARGGMGAIISTRDLDTRRNLVTKVLLKSASKKALLRFIEEAQITAQLEHPNIVPIYDIGVNKDGNIYYTMKHVKGNNLQQLIERSITNPNENKLTMFLEILISICNAVAFAHSKKVIHRDLKPENIMVGEYGEVILMDFGLAKILTMENSSEIEELSDVVTSDRLEFNEMRTMQGDITGTPKFMAPEQAKGDIHDQDERTDIYALGAILFACIAKKPPISGSSLPEILQNVIKGNRNELSKTIAPELVAVINKAMAINKTERYQTVKEFSNDLQLFLKGFSITAKDDRFTEKITKFVKRNKSIFLTSLITLLLSIASILFLNVFITTLIGLALILVFGLIAINKIIHERKEAVNNLNKFLLAKKLTEEEKAVNENLQKERVKVWKPIYQENFQDMQFHLIPEKVDHYGHGNWGVPLVGFENDNIDISKILNQLSQKVWVEKNALHFFASNSSYLYLNKSFFGNLRIDTIVTFISGETPEITLFLNGSIDRQELDGYTLAIGPKLKFQKRGQTIHEQELSAPLSFKSKQHILFERIGSFFKAYVNDLSQPIFQWEDPDPIYGEKFSIVGFYVWHGEIAIDTFIVAKQAWAKQNSPNDFVQLLRCKGKDQLALEMYKEIIFSTENLYHKAEALFEMGVTYKRLGLNIDATINFMAFTERKKPDNFPFDIPFDQVEHFINKSFLLLFIISLEDYFNIPVSNLEKWPLSLEVRYNEMITHSQDDDSINMIATYFFTKIINLKNDSATQLKTIYFFRMLFEEKNEKFNLIFKKIFYSRSHFLISFIKSLRKNLLFEYLLSELLKINNNDSKALSERGFLRLGNNNEESLQLGLKDLYKSIELDPLQISSYDYLAIYFNSTGQYSNSEKILLQGIKIQPNSLDHNFELAVVYRYMHNYELFEQQINICNKIKPNQPKVNDLQGRFFYENKMIQPLEELLAVENGKKFNLTQYRNLKGLLFLATKKYKDAIELFNSTLKENPKNYPTMSILSQAYYENEEFQNAIDLLLKISAAKALSEVEKNMLESSFEKLKTK